MAMMTAQFGAFIQYCTISLETVCILHFYISFARIYYLRISLYEIGGCGLISELVFETLYTALAAKITSINIAWGRSWTLDF